MIRRALAWWRGLPERREFKDFIQKYQLFPGAAIETHLTHREKIQLFLLAKQQAGGVYVEIGSFVGASAYFIGSALMQLQQDATLYCIDTWENDAMTEGKRQTWQQFQDNTATVYEKIEPLKGFSYEVVKAFDRPVDFLFIDGDHSYEGVKRDVDDWLKKVKPGGVVIFHDVGWAEGVNRVIEEQVADKVKASGRLPNMYWAWLK